MIKMKFVFKGWKFPFNKFYPANDKSGKFNVAGKYDKSSLVKFKRVAFCFLLK